MGAESMSFNDTQKLETTMPIRIIQLDNPQSPSTFSH